MAFNKYPWEQSVAPFWVNPENGFIWYQDQDFTDYCAEGTPNDLPPLDAVVFFVCKDRDGEISPLSRVLVDKRTNQALADESATDKMATKIDMLRLAKYVEINGALPPVSLFKLPPNPTAP